MSAAVITMSHNEKHMLPLWVKHRSSSLEAENLYVLDHGSTDGSTTGFGDVNVIRVPGDKFDDHARAEAASSLQRALSWFRP